MNNEEEVIEILDDFEDNTIKIPPIKNIDIGNVTPVEPMINNEVSPMTVNSNLGVSASEEIKPKQEIYNEVKKLEEVKYNPIEPEKKEIKIDETEEENSKSGLGFIIVLFILLAAFIIALPYISKLF